MEGKSRLSFNFDEDGVGFLPGLIRSERGESTFEKGGRSGSLDYYFPRAGGGASLEIYLKILRRLS